MPQEENSPTNSSSYPGVDIAIDAYAKFAQAVNTGESAELTLGTFSLKVDKKSTVRHQFSLFFDKHFTKFLWGTIIFIFLFLLGWILGLSNIVKTLQYFKLDPREGNYMACMKAGGNDITCSKIAGYK